MYGSNLPRQEKRTQVIKQELSYRVGEETYRGNGRVRVQALEEPSDTQGHISTAETGPEMSQAGETNMAVQEQIERVQENVTVNRRYGFSLSLALSTVW